MTVPIRIVIQVSIATLLLGGTFALPASASSGDPMSRDVEFRESLARRDDLRESTVWGPVNKVFTRRTDAPKKDRAPR
jgi:hypothetical protein